MTFFSRTYSPSFLCHRGPRLDNIFGAYQLSLDSKELAYSQLFSVLDTKTARGFIPNFWDAQQVSWDRTEPVIGSKVQFLLSFMHRHHQSKTSLSKTHSISLMAVTL